MKMSSAIIGEDEDVKELLGHREADLSGETDLNGEADLSGEADLNALREKIQFMI